MKINKLLVGLMMSVTLVAGAAQAAELSIVSGDTGTGLEFLRSQLDKFEADTGNTVTIVPMPSSTTTSSASTSCGWRPAIPISTCTRPT